jgi:hypothetical protein
MRRAGVLWVLALCWTLATGLGLWLGGDVDAAPTAKSSVRPAGVGRGSVSRQGKPPRHRGEIPATVGVASGPTMAGSAVYPAQDIPLRFTHDQHLALNLSCDRCHDRAATSKRSSDLLIPTGAACDGCHGQQHPRPADEPARCEMCHTKVEDGERLTASVRMPRPLLHFNHELHTRRGQDCKDCHDMSRVRLGSVLQLPTEASCLTCHDGFTATDRCGACHPAGSDGRLLTRAQDDRTLPALVPRGASAWGAAHDLMFVEDHAAVAKSGGKLCNSCHDDAFCIDCHDGPLRPMRIHSGDYMTLHAMDARAATSDCQSCHRTQTFCQGCHERVGFGQRDDGEFGVGGALQFHPSDWSGPPGMPQGHAHAAQRNIGTCVSCHTEDSCLACHATTGAATPGLDVSPHGPDFARSARCDALAGHNRRMCLRCHAPGDPQLECI